MDYIWGCGFSPIFVNEKHRLRPYRPISHRTQLEPLQVPIAGEYMRSHLSPNLYMYAYCESFLFKRLQQKSVTIYTPPTIALMVYWKFMTWVAAVKTDKLVLDPTIYGVTGASNSGESFLLQVIKNSRIS